MKLAWLRRNGERLFLGTFAGIAFVGSILALSSYDWLVVHYFRDSILAIILILLATFILSFLFGYERRVIEMTSIINDCKSVVEQSRAGMAEHVRKWERLGITEIYRSRDDDGQKQEYLKLLRKASEDLFIIGVTLKDLTLHEQPTLIDKATSGCSVRLLMLLPARWKNESPILDPVESGDLKEHFVSSLRNLRKIALIVSKKNEDVKPKRRRTIGRSRLPKKTPGYSLEVRFYDQSPALSMSVADAHLESGRMRVEFTPHNETDRGAYFRPMLDLVPKDDGLLGLFYLHYSGLWDKSKPYLCVSGSKIYVNSQLDKEVSELLSLRNDWVPTESLGEDLAKDKAHHTV
jgi:hypothetical protein